MSLDPVPLRTSVNVFPASGASVTVFTLFCRFTVLNLGVIPMDDVKGPRVNVSLLSAEVKTASNVPWGVAITPFIQHEAATHRPAQVRTNTHICHSRQRPQ